MNDSKQAAATLTSNRFHVPESGDVYDRWGRHFIERSLWDERISEGRADWANHRFQRASRVDEPGVPSQWHRVRAFCTRCGEERLVWFGARDSDLNEGWCIPQAVPLWRRIFGGVVVTDSKTVVGWRGVFRRAWFRVFPPAPEYRERQGWYW